MATLTSLQEQIIDEMILTFDPKLMAKILTMPACVLETLDKRVEQLEKTQRYQDRFSKLNVALCENR